MSKEQPDPSTLNQCILDIIRGSKPATVEELVKLVQVRQPLPEQEITKHVLDLQSQGKLTLHERQSPIPLTMKGYLLSPQAYWYWITIILALTTLITVFAIPEKAFPAVYARYILGAIFVLWLPGYSFIKALFPTKVPIPTGKKELDNIERAALSAGMSLALVPITGLFLNYTPWGITLVPITLSLLALTVAFATIAIIREYQTAHAIGE